MMSVTLILALYAVSGRIKILSFSFKSLDHSAALHVYNPFTNSQVPNLLFIILRFESTHTKVAYRKNIHYYDYLPIPD